MPNALIPRETVHAWSEEIAEQINSEQSALQRLLRSQRRLTRFIEENNAHMEPTTAGVSVYMTAVIIRMFDLAGGRMKNATWDKLRAAQAKVQGQLDAVLPYDEGFLERFRGQQRAQAHILDEAAMALLETTPEDQEEEVNEQEGLKILLLMWVITEVLDANWTPPKNFKGETDYAYVHIEPTVPESGEE